MKVRKRVRNRVDEVKPNEALAPAPAVRRDATVAEFARYWLKLRTERTRAADTQRIRDHVLPVLGTRRVRDVKAEDVAHVVRLMLAKKGMKPKSARNAYDVFAELLGAALEQNIASDDPRDLPQDIWPAEAAAPRPLFSRAEVVALTTDERLDADQRLYNLLAFRSGLVSERVCELTFENWAAQVQAPFLAELAAAIEHWQNGGFEAVYGRAPSAQDYLVPRRSDVSRAHTDGSAFKAFRRACVRLGIKTRSPNAVTNTFEEDSAAQPAADAGALKAPGAS